jgi:hypothetical protein
VLPASRTYILGSVRGRPKVIAKESNHPSQTVLSATAPQAVPENQV